MKKPPLSDDEINHELTQRVLLMPLSDEPGSETIGDIVRAGLEAHQWPEPEKMAPMVVQGMVLVLEASLPLSRDLAKGLAKPKPKP